MLSSLKDKSAIVTGAGGGINLEFARQLLQQGANVLLADLVARPEARELLDQYTVQPKAVFQTTDVASWESLTEMFKRAQAEFGNIDIVCPGAGVFEPPWSNFWHPPGSVGSRDDLQGSRYKTIDINLVHPMRVTQMAISHFLSSVSPPGPQNPKMIVHIASIAGEGSSISFPLYHASKWGLVGFIHSLADLESMHGIRVTGVAPGIVKTPLWLDHADKTKMVMKNGEMQNDWITPETVATRMVQLLTQDETTGLNDRPIKIRGGLILEVGAVHIREVPMHNNEGPARDQPGMKLANAQESLDNVVQQLQTPGWGQ